WRPGNKTKVGITCVFIAVFIPSGPKIASPGCMGRIGVKGDRSVDGRFDRQRSGGRVDGGLGAQRDCWGMPTVSGRKPTEDGNAGAGQPIPQDLDDAPAAVRRIACAVFESEELAQCDAVQALENPRAAHLGQSPVDFAQAGTLLVFEKEDRASKARQTGAGRG